MGYKKRSYLAYKKLIEQVESFEPNQDVKLIKEFQTNYLVFHFDRYDNPEEVKNQILESMSSSQNFKFVTNFDNNYIYQVVYD